jgi:hypothetical protein
MQCLYTSSLDEHASAGGKDCALPDFAGMPPRATPGIYWRTLRHLRAAQLFELIRNRIFPKAKLRRWDPVEVKLRNQLPPSLMQWKPDEAKHLLVQSHVHTDGLQAMRSGEGSRFETELCQMTAWRFECFDFVNVDLTSRSDASLLRQALRQIVNWWEQHSTGGEMGRQPQALSLRIVNWLKFVARNAIRADELGDGSTIEQILGSLRLQTPSRALPGKTFAK